jgi:hypothetical protein
MMSRIVIVTYDFVFKIFIVQIKVFRLLLCKRVLLFDNKI